MPSGSSYPASRPWCRPEPQAARPRARGQLCCGDGRAGSTLFHAFGPSRRTGIQGRPTETHDHSQPRRENWTMWPQDTAHGTFTHSRAIAQAVPTGRGNIPNAPQLLETRPFLATQDYTFKSSEQDASRPGDGAPARPATRPTSTGQAPEPRAGVLRGETKALNGDPGAWPASHRRSGAEDPLPARSEAPRMGGLGEMLVDPSEQPQLWSAAPGRL